MALKLMDPVYNLMPFFQPNQVLTYNHLNKMAAYLYQQDRYTRNKLIGSGIVCGLSFDWKTVSSKVQVVVEEGCAITSAGYLIVFKQPVDNTGTIVPYTHKRSFARLKDIEPFKNVPAIGSKAIYELLTLDQFNAETEIPKSVLLDADKTDYVLVMLFDIETLNIAKCLDESCDDKGKLYQFTPKPVLVPKAVIDHAKVLGLTEEGRGWKGTQKKLQLTYLGVPNLFLNPAIKLSNITSNQDLQKLFTDACEVNGYVNTVKTKLNSLITAYPWVLRKQLESMLIEVPGLTVSPVNLGDIFKNKVQDFIASVSYDNYSQYLYDYIRDVADCYNDLYSLVTDLEGECGGNENLYPFHVLLGIPQTRDTLASYEELKFNESNYKYRNYFIPSPVVGSQFNLYEKVQHTLKRLVRVIAFFSLDIELKDIKVIPSKDYDESFGIRAIPYYYDKNRFEDFYRIWNYDSTRHNKVSNPKGYHGSPPQTQADLLRNDTRKIDFYRIEGHIEHEIEDALKQINEIRNEFNLPFSVVALPLQPENVTTSCSFPDLEEEFNYYRDRVLGYLREFIFWFEKVRKLENYPALNDRFEGQPDKMYECLKILSEILTKTRCIEDFNYRAFKEIYSRIFEAIFYIYRITIAQNMPAANQVLNGMQNVWNTVLFRPLYRVMYFYKYRMMLIKAKVTHKSLSETAKKQSGFEHLAGVRRGEIFLMVYDKDQSDRVVADFNIPALPQCECDCQPDACNGEHRAFVHPLQKPIIMVIDSAKMEAQNNDGRLFARYDPKDHQFILELDSMGFYKGDSEINDVRVTQKEEDFPGMMSEFKNEKFIFRYKPDDNEDFTTGNIYMLTYILKGNFENELNGMFMLVIIGKQQKPGALDNNYTHFAHRNEAAQPFYVYDKALYERTKPEIAFVRDFKITTVGEESVPVYTSPGGNQVAIFKDNAGMPFFKVITAAAAGVEEIPYFMDTRGIRTKGSFNLNVVMEDETFANTTFSGRVLDESGAPVENAKITTSSGKEIYSNNNGEFNFTELKAGEVITIQRSGFAATSVQVNNQLASEIRVQKAGILGIKELADFKLPDNISRIGSGIDLNNFKDIFK